MPPKPPPRITMRLFIAAPSELSREILDGNRLDVAGRLESEDAPEEVELCVEGALDIFGLAETMSLAFESNIGVRQTLAPQSLNHDLRLIGWDDLVVETLEDNHR